MPTPAVADAPAATDVLVTPVVKRRPHRSRSRTLAFRIASLVALLVAWWLAAWHVADVAELPNPWQVLDNLVSLTRGQHLLENIAFSLGLAARGFVIGVAIGFTLGALAGLTLLGEELLDAPMQMIRVIPFAALLPLFVLWFGLGDTPKVALIALACTFPTYLQTYLSVRNVDRRVVEAARSFGLSGSRLLREVTVPMALPGIINGLRFAGSISVLALVIAEQLNASKGVGAMLFNAQSYSQWLTVFSIVAVYMLFGLGIDLLFRLVERVLLPWRSGVALR